MTNFRRAGTRPALVIQNDVGNRFGSTVIVVKLETIVTLPKRAILRRLSHLPAEVIGEVDEALAFSLDLRLAPARKLS